MLWLGWDAYWIVAARQTVTHTVNKEDGVGARVALCIAAKKWDMAAVVASHP
jgi:hypothetical protein